MCTPMIGERSAFWQWIGEMNDAIKTIEPLTEEEREFLREWNRQNDPDTEN
jgi:hypothetical protein